MKRLCQALSPVSTETALLRVFNHRLLAVDSENLVVLVLLHLSATFYKVTYQIILFPL